MNARTASFLPYYVPIFGVGLPGANNDRGTVITVDEVRTHRLSLINDKGNVVHEWVVHGGWFADR